MIPPTKLDRLRRLKMRLGSKSSHKLKVRIKPGGWVTLPHDMVCSLGLKGGDSLDFQIGDGTVVVERAEVKTRIRMAMLTARNLPDDVHRALRVRAAQHGHSTEAEVREILANAVKPEKRVRLGEALAALGRKIGLTKEEFEVFDRVRDKTPAEPPSFE